MYRCTIATCGLTFADSEHRADHMQLDYHCPHCGWSDESTQTTANLNQLCRLCEVSDQPYKENA